MTRVVLCLLLVGCGPTTDKNKQLVPIDAGIDAAPWRAVIICQGDVACRAVDAITVCTSRDPSCRVVPATTLDAGVDAPFSPLAEAPLP